MNPHSCWEKNLQTHKHCVYAVLFIFNLQCPVKTPSSKVTSPFYPACSPMTLRHILVIRVKYLLTVGQGIAGIYKRHDELVSSTIPISQMRKPSH